MYVRPCVSCQCCSTHPVPQEHRHPELAIPSESLIAVGRGTYRRIQTKWREVAREGQARVATIASSVEFSHQGFGRALRTRHVVSQQRDLRRSVFRVIRRMRAVVYRLLVVLSGTPSELCKPSTRHKQQCLRTSIV
jgi:hypothetical protein